MAELSVIKWPIPRRAKRRMTPVNPATNAPTSDSPVTVGYTVGRFNPLQLGHQALLQQVADNNTHLVVLVGSATESRTHKNPLNFEERKSLILAMFPHAIVMPLPDMASDADWVKMFETTVTMGIDRLRLEGPVKARLYSADATRADDYALRCEWVRNLGHEVVPFAPVMARTDLSASLVRDNWYSGRKESVRELVPAETMALLEELDIGWMKSHYIKKVPLGERSPERNAVFVAFVSDPEHLYQVDPACREWGHDAWFAKLSMLGYVVRWNGELGFVGGRVDEGESLEQALVRECFEEVGHVLDMSRVSLVASHAMVGKGPVQHVHLYLCRVSADELFGIRQRAYSAPHSRTEMSAFAATHLTPEAPDMLLSQKWCGGAGEQLKVLLYSGLVPKAEVVVNDYPLA